MEISSGNLYNEYNDIYTNVPARWYKIFESVFRVMGGLAILFGKYEKTKTVNESLGATTQFRGANLTRIHPKYPCP